MENNLVYYKNNILSKIEKIEKLTKHWHLFMLIIKIKNN